MRRALAIIATLLLVAGGLFMALLNVGEKLIYFPQPLTPTAGQAILARHPQALEVTLTTSDGAQLHGWHLPAGTGSARPLVLYFGGNAEEVSWMLEFGSVFAGWDLGLMNYRGYGLSSGHPSERTLLGDALAVYDHFIRRPTIDPARVVVIGRSLGSGVASHLASQRPVRGVLLVTPFASITEVAQDFYPLLPVRTVLGDLYDSATLAPRLTVPLRMIVAGRDEVIAAQHSERLFTLWAGPKERVTIASAGHNDLQGYREYWQAIQEFLQRQ
ncbi:MAG: alpha/beta hydrolase [Candidatus Competibacter denitrificans]